MIYINKQHKSSDCFEPPDHLIIIGGFFDNELKGRIKCELHLLYLR